MYEQNNSAKINKKLEFKIIASKKHGFTLIKRILADFIRENPPNPRSSMVYSKIS